jgi:hypothetical protein
MYKTTVKKTCITYGRSFHSRVCTMFTMSSLLKFEHDKSTNLDAADKLIHWTVLASYMRYEDVRSH